jgi:hypothetical protein
MPDMTSLEWALAKLKTQFMNAPKQPEGLGLEVHDDAFTLGGLVYFRPYATAKRLIPAVFNLTSESAGIVNQSYANPSKLEQSCTAEQKRLDRLIPGITAEQLLTLLGHSGSSSVYAEATF